MENGQLTWITNFIWGIADLLAVNKQAEGLVAEILASSP
jgi:hypothetical protein